MTQRVLVLSTVNSWCLKLGLYRPKVNIYSVMMKTQLDSGDDHTSQSLGEHMKYYR